MYKDAIRLNFLREMTQKCRFYLIDDISLEILKNFMRGWSAIKISMA